MAEISILPPKNRDLDKVQIAHQAYHREALSGFLHRHSHLRVCRKLCHCLPSSTTHPSLSLSEEGHSADLIGRTSEVPGQERIWSCVQVAWVAMVTGG